MCRPGSVAGLWCEGLREAPASVPGLGRNPGRHEAGGLGAAPRRRQGKAAAWRGTRTAAAGPPGCGDERGGSSWERLHGGGRRQGTYDRALPARAGHCHLRRYGSPRRGRAAITGDSDQGDATSCWDLCVASTYLGSLYPVSGAGVRSARPTTLTPSTPGDDRTCSPVCGLLSSTPSPHLGLHLSLTEPFLQSFPVIYPIPPILAPVTDI